MTAGGSHGDAPPPPLAVPIHHPHLSRFILQPASWIIVVVLKVLTKGLVFQAGRVMVFYNGL